MEAGLRKKNIIFRKDEAEYFRRAIWTVRGALKMQAEAVVWRSFHGLVCCGRGALQS
jgi:hypothetical protein